MQTIIECLKYSTTGELPPNSKGGAFIHDPSVSMSNPMPMRITYRLLAVRRKGGPRTGQVIVSQYFRRAHGHHAKPATHREEDQ